MLTFGFSKPWNNPALLPCALLRFFRAFAHFCAHFFPLQNPCPRRDFFRTGSFTELRDGKKGFEVKNAFLKFTTTEKVTLKGAGLFVVNGQDVDEVTIGAGADQYVAVNASANATLTVEFDGVEYKTSQSNKIEKQKIYPIGSFNPNLVHLVPSSNWKEANATFKAYFFNNSTSTNKWVDLADGNGDGIYTALIPDGTWPNVIFVRMNPAGTNADPWSNKWTQTSDLTVNTTNNYYYVYDWDYGCWNNSEYKNNPVAIVDRTTYDTIKNALNVASTSKVITLLADATVSQQCIINKNNHKLTITGNFGETSKYGDGYAYVFPVSNWKIYGIGGWDDAHAITMYIEKSTANNVSIARNVTLTSTTEFKFRNGGTWKGCYAAFTLSGAFPDANSWYQINNNHNANIKATDANGSKYDIFFDHQNYKFYICLSSKKHDI